ncbi:hypothetical protein MLDJOKPK_00047 [Salmonella phage SPAsTU]|nr:hypothetical protein STsAS_091 [Salmonella phage STsAS]AWN08999.1 hypothetical protein MLDJOKPK_00047 [Salmonella phage SPAsTU]
MWLSAIHRDLPKRNETFSVTQTDNVLVADTIEVGVTKFDRMEEGQYVVVDDNENEFMLFHPEVDASEIRDGSLLFSWQDKETKQWKWCVANPTNAAGTAYAYGRIHIEPKPH